MAARIPAASTSPAEPPSGAARHEEQGAHSRGTATDLSWNGRGLHEQRTATKDLRIAGRQQLDRNRRACPPVHGNPIRLETHGTGKARLDVHAVAICHRTVDR